MQVKAVQPHIQLSSAEGYVHVLDVQCPHCQTRYRIFSPLGAEATAQAKAQAIREHITSKCRTEHADVINFSI